MQNFNNINEAKVAAVKYFAEEFGYFDKVTYKNRKGIIQFYTEENKHTFFCTIFTINSKT